MAGIYLHVPFCQSKCIYCGFYSVVNSSVQDQYVPALKREISERRDFFNNNISTLYIGGGTPSSLRVSELDGAVEAVAEGFKLPFGDRLDFEFTVEVNPDDITPAYATGLKALGVNRVSMGVQSFNDEHLRWMRRRHSATEAVAAFDALREAGFGNISLDLIFGYAGLTMAEWKATLTQALALAPEHISAYQTSLDAHSALNNLARRGLYSAPSDEECAAQYALLQEVMAKAGYLQYEVSNFAKSGRRSHHNSNYWNRTPYLGLGPGAHSFCGRRREWNKNDVVKYCALSTCDKLSPTAFTDLRESELLSDRDIYNETVMLGLRTVNGLAFSALDAETRALVRRVLATPEMRETIAALEGEDCLLSHGNLLDPASDYILKIPPEKLFVSDDIILQLILYAAH